MLGRVYYLFNHHNGIRYKHRDYRLVVVVLSQVFVNLVGCLAILVEDLSNLEGDLT